jgi:hypothetical protein
MVLKIIIKFVINLKKQHPCKRWNEILSSPKWIGGYPVDSEDFFKEI